MKVSIDYIGEVEYSKDDIFHFESGLYGFEECTKFLIVQNPHMEIPFYYLVSLDKSDLMFVMTNPFLFVEDYDFEVPDKMVSELEINTVEDITIYSMVVIPDDPKATTTNLKAPLVVNHQLKRGAQCILTEEYPSKHEIFGKEEKNADSI